MSTTDVTDVASAVEGLQIDGPQAAPPAGEHTWAVVGADGEEHDITAAVTKQTREALFDASGFNTVPTMDGNAADKLVIGFSGSISYDATDDQGRRLFESLTLGKPVTMQVEGFVSGKQGGYKENAEGEETVTGKATVKVVSVYVSRPEDLG